MSDTSPLSLSLFGVHVSIRACAFDHTQVHHTDVIRIAANELLRDENVIEHLVAAVVDVR
jgi:hypothetical protein